MLRYLLRIAVGLLLATTLQAQDISFYITEPYAVRAQLRYADAMERVLQLHNDRVVLESLEMIPAEFSGRHFRITNVESGGPVQRRSVAGLRGGRELALQYPRTEFDLLGAIARYARDERLLESYVADTRRTTARVYLQQEGEFPILHEIRAGARPRSQPWQPALASRYRLRVDGVPVVLWTAVPSRGGPTRIFEALDKQRAKRGNLSVTIDHSGSLTFLDHDRDQDLSAEWHAALERAGIDLLSVSAGGVLRYLKRDAASRVLPELPIVASNMTVEDEELQSRLVNVWHRTVGTVRVAVLSLVSQSKQELKLQRQHGIHIADPVETAAVLIRELHERGEADVVACVSQLLQVDEARLLHNATGCDIVFSHDENLSGAERRNDVHMRDWRNYRPHAHPALVTYYPSASYGEVRARFARRKGRVVPVKFSEHPGGELVHSQRTSRWDRLMRQWFDRYTKSPRPVLPDPRALWPDSGRTAYHGVEFWNLVAHTLRSAGESEIALAHMRPLYGETLGEVTEPYVQRWLGGESKVFRAHIRGATLKQLRRYLHPGKHDDDGALVREASLRAKPYLAMAGISAQGYVGGAPIRNDELYSITFTEDVLQHHDFPELKIVGKRTLLNGSRKTFIIDWLAGQRERLQSEAYARMVRNAVEGQVHSKPVWRLELRKLSASFANTSVRNNERFTEVRDAKVRSLGQLMARMELDAHSVVRWNDLLWDTGLGVNYGRIIFRRSSGDVTNETADQLLLTTEIAYRVAQVQRGWFDHSVGPFLRLAYDTEFTAPTGIRSRKSFFIKPGLQLYDGTYLRSLYANALIEADFADGATNTEYGYEVGAKAVVPLAQTGLQWHFDARYEEFMPASHDTADDLRRILDLQTSLSVPVWGNLRLRPYFKYYLFRGKVVPVTGHNMLIGVSFDYSSLWKPVR